MIFEVHLSPQKVLQSRCCILYNDELVAAPFVSSPSPFPKSQFNLAVSLQTDFNVLVATLVKEREYLCKLIETFTSDDPFVQRLFQIMRECPDPSNVLFTILRSDYMMDAPSGQLLQVELNTGSLALGALSDKLSLLYRKIDEKVPSNNFIERASCILSRVHREWESKHSVKDAIILFIVILNESNIEDQLLLADATEKFGIKIVRATLKDNFSIENGFLVHLGSKVSIVYFRAGYSPDQYGSDIEWANRQLIEQTLAVKCPNIPTQLAGLKLVQQSLCDMSFIKANNLNIAMQCTFAEQHSISDYDGCISRLQADPEGYVLKPQREGGGNNIYGGLVLDYIKKIPEKARAAYTLQKFINAPRLENVAAFRLGRKVIIKEAVSELGIMGVYYESQESFVNAPAGWLLRTKSADQGEGGVVSGFGFLDAPSLID